MTERRQPTTRVCAPPSCRSVRETWERAPDAATRTWLLALFIVNAALNVLWSALFFRLRRPDWAFAELVVFWMSILALVLFIGSYSVLAAAVMAPYLVWVTFAGALNLRLVQLNAPFGGAAGRG